MPETEAAYLQQLVQIVGQVHLARVIRPAVCKIVDLHSTVREYLDSLAGER